MTTVLHSDEPGSGHAAGRPAVRPTGEKMGWPTPCQKHCRKRFQKALLSRFSSDRTQGSREALRRPRRWSAGRTKRKPPKHGFYSCCASKKHPRRGHQIADSIAVGHPDEMEKKQFFVLSPYDGALWTGGAREAGKDG